MTSSIKSFKKYVDLLIIEQEPELIKAVASEIIATLHGFITHNTVIQAADDGSKYQTELAIDLPNFSSSTHSRIAAFQTIRLFGDSIKLIENFLNQANILNLKSKRSIYSYNVCDVPDFIGYTSLLRVRTRDESTGSYDKRRFIKPFVYLDISSKSTAQKYPLCFTRKNYIEGDIALNEYSTYGLCKSRRIDGSVKHSLLPEMSIK